MVKLLSRLTPVGKILSLLIWYVLAVVLPISTYTTTLVVVVNFFAKYVPFVSIKENPLIHIWLAPSVVMPYH